MSDADKPWSSPPAGSSSGSNSAPPSTPAVAPVPKAPVSTHEDLRASFAQSAAEYHRKIEAERKAAEQGQGQMQGQGVSMPPSLTPSKTMDENGDHPHIVVPENVTHATSERFAARDEENAWLARLESSKGSNAAAPTDGPQSGSRSQSEEARVRGAGEHHRDEQRGWAEYANTEAAGERQHDSEERRSLGLSL